MSEQTLIDFLGGPNTAEINISDIPQGKTNERVIKKNPLLKDYLFGREVEIWEAFSRIPLPEPPKEEEEVKPQPNPTNQVNDMEVIFEEYVQQQPTVPTQKKFDAVNFHENKTELPWSYQMNQMLFLKGFTQLLEKFKMAPSDKTVEDTPFLHEFIDFLKKYGISFPKKKFNTILIQKEMADGSKQEETHQAEVIEQSVQQQTNIALSNAPINLQALGNNSNIEPLLLQALAHPGLEKYQEHQILKIDWKDQTSLNQQDISQVISTILLKKNDLHQVIFNADITDQTLTAIGRIVDVQNELNDFSLILSKLNDERRFEGILSKVSLISSLQEFEIKGNKEMNKKDLAKLKKTLETLEKLVHVTVGIRCSDRDLLKKISKSLEKVTGANVHVVSV